MVRTPKDLDELIFMVITVLVNKTATPDMIPGGNLCWLEERDNTIDGGCLAYSDRLTRSSAGLMMAHKGSKIVH